MHQPPPPGSHWHLRSILSPFLSRFVFPCSFSTCSISLSYPLFLPQFPFLSASLLPLRLPFLSANARYELESAHHTNPDYLRQTFPVPRLWLRVLVGWPIIALVTLLSLAPVMAMLFAITQTSFYQSDLHGSPSAIMEWFSTPQRIGYYVAIKVCTPHHLNLFFPRLTVSCLPAYDVGHCYSQSTRQIVYY